MLDVDSLLKNASEIPDPIEKAIANEMALLILNDAIRYPVPGAKIHGSSKSLEKFDDETLDKARLEIMLEVPEDGVQDRQEEFEKAWDEVHNSTKLLGLVGYAEDEIDEYQVMVQAFDVSIRPHPHSPMSNRPTHSPPLPEHPRQHHLRRRKRQQDRKETRRPSRWLPTARQDSSPENRRGGGRAGESQDRIGYSPDDAKCGGSGGSDEVGGVEGGGRVCESEGEGGAGGI